jgi:hypothetical protein
VTRINRKVLIGGAAVVLLLVAFLVLVALQPPKLQVGTPRELINVENKPTPESLARLPASYDSVRTERPPEPIRPPSGIPQLTRGRRRSHRPDRTDGTCAARPHGGTGT